MRDLALVKQTREVGFHLGSSGELHAQSEEAMQVVLHQGELASVQTPLPGLLGSPTFLMG